MDFSEKILWLIGAAVLLLMISFLGNKAEKILNFVLRNIVGTIALCFINMGISAAGLSVVVGINLATVLTAGILGIPGIALLYGLRIYHFVQNGI